MRRKTCTHCKVEKPEVCFSVSPKGKDGLNALCRECVHEYNLGYWARKKEAKRLKDLDNYESLLARASARRKGTP